MPCNDGGGPSHTEYVDDPKLAAALCAVLTVLESFPSASGNDFERVMSRIDWKEAGITERYLRGWWERHKDEDRERRKREREDRERRRVQKAHRRSALLKLTPQERRALGLSEE